MGLACAYRFGEQKIVIFRLDSQVFEYGVRPEAFHVIPILDLAVPYWIVNTIAWVVACCEGFVSDEEVEIFGASFSC